jgi:hypothetical protein
MLQLLGQLMKLPMEAFVYSMEMFVKTMRGIQQIASRGVDMVADEIVQTLDNASGIEGDAPTKVMHGTLGNSAEIIQQMPQEENRKMSDKDLRDDMLKLVRYKVLFVKRDYEHVFYEKEELVHDNITEADYIGWKIAEFIQNLHKEEVPETWRKKGYPRVVKDDEEKPKINKLDEDDKKYLRVYFEVLDRYTRERFKYEEEQIDVLKEIRDRLERKVEIEERQARAIEDVSRKLGPASSGGQSST